MDINQKTQPANFDEVRATLNAPVEEIPPEQPAEVQPETAPPETPAPAEAALQVAELAAQKLQQAEAQAAALTQENQQLQEAMQQMSEQNKEAVVEQVIEAPALEMPTLDFAQLMYDDADTVAAKQAEHSVKMSAYIAELVKRGQTDVLGQITPLLQAADEANAQNQKTATIQRLSAHPELPDFAEMLPQMERIIANNKALQSSSNQEEALITAYAIAKGVNAINTPKAEATQPTTEQLLELYNKNPELQQAIEKQKLENIKEGQQVPPFSANGSAGNAALNIPKKPQSFDDVRKIINGSR